MGKIKKSETPVKPIRVDDDRTDGCPICGREFFEKFNYCPDCGSELEWGDCDEQRSNV